MGHVPSHETCLQFAHIFLSAVVSTSSFLLGTGRRRRGRGWRPAPFAFLARARDRPVAAGEDRRRGQGIRNVPDDPLLDLAPPPGQRVPRRRLDEARSADRSSSLAATSCHCLTAVDL